MPFDADTPDLHPAATRIELAADPDATSAVPLLAAARRAVAAGRPVVVDCGAAAFIPFAVAQVLLALARACERGGLPLTVEGLAESAAAHIRRAGLTAPFRQ